MSLNKITYEALGLFISDTGSSYSADQDFSLINLVQDASFDFNINRENIKQIATTPNDDFVAQPILNEPTVNLNYSYLANQLFLNEKKLGFHIGDDNSIFKNYSSTAIDDKNIAFLIANSGDYNELQFSQNYTGYDVLGLGNCFLTNYSIEASVNSFSKVSVSYLCSNVEYGTYNANSKLPSINLVSGNQEDPYSLTITDTGSTEADYFRSSDITLQLENPDFGAEISGGHLQNFAINVPIERNDLYGFGSNYVRNRKIKFPIMANISFSLVAHKFNTGNLANIFNQDSSYDFKITLFPQRSRQFIQATITGNSASSSFMVRQVDGNADAQSFTVIKAGKLSSARITPAQGNAAGTNYQLNYKLYRGDGISGPIMETGSTHFTVSYLPDNSQQYDDVHFTFTGEHYVYKDEVFTIGFDNDDSSDTDIFRYSGAASDVYDGGRFYQDYDFDTDHDPADVGSNADAALMAISFDQIPMTYEIEGAKMMSQNFSSSIGSLSTVDATFQFPITKTKGLQLTSKYLESNFAQEYTSTLEPALWLVPDTE